MTMKSAWRNYAGRNDYATNSRPH